MMQPSKLALTKAKMHASGVCLLQHKSFDNFVSPCDADDIETSLAFVVLDLCYLGFGGVKQITKNIPELPLVRCARSSEVYSLNS